MKMHFQSFILLVAISATLPLAEAQSEFNAEPKSIRQRKLKGSGKDAKDKKDKKDKKDQKDKKDKKDKKSKMSMVEPFPILELGKPISHGTFTDFFGVQKEMTYPNLLFDNYVSSQIAMDDGDRDTVAILYDDVPLVAPGKNLFFRLGGDVRWFGNIASSPPPGAFPGLTDEEAIAAIAVQIRSCNTCFFYEYLLGEDYTILFAKDIFEGDAFRLDTQAKLRVNLIASATYLFNKKEVVVKIDGKEVPDAQQYYTKTPALMPPPALTVALNTTRDYFSATGFYMLIPPLEPGHHVIETSVSLSLFAVDGTFAPAGFSVFDEFVYDFCVGDETTCDMDRKLVGKRADRSRRLVRSFDGEDCIFSFCSHLIIWKSIQDDG